MFLKRFSRRQILDLSALLWLSAGVILLHRAVIWLSADDLQRQVGLVVASIGLTVVGYRSVFWRVVSANYARVASASEPLGLGAVTSIRGLVMIAGMMTVGILLRSSPIPRDYLIVPYGTMGSMLFTGALRLWRQRSELPKSAVRDASRS